MRVAIIMGSTSDLGKVEDFNEADKKISLRKSSFSSRS